MSSSVNATPKRDSPAPVDMDIEFKTLLLRYVVEVISPFSIKDIAQAEASIMLLCQVHGIDWGLFVIIAMQYTNKDIDLNDTYDEYLRLTGGSNDTTETTC